MSLKVFDPENQRTLRDVREVWISPAREAILTPANVERARERVRAACDAVDLPSSKARALVDDVASGRTFFGSEGFLPAYVDLAPLGRVPARGRALRAGGSRGDHRRAPRRAGPRRRRRGAEGARAALPRRRLLRDRGARGGPPRTRAPWSRSTARASRARPTIRPRWSASRSRPAETAVAGHPGSVRSGARHQGGARLAREDGRAGAAGAAGARLAGGGAPRGPRGARRDAGGAAGDAAPAPRPQRQGAPRQASIRRPSTTRRPPPGRRRSSWWDRSARGVVAPAEGLALVTEEEIFGARAHRRAARAASSDQQEPRLRRGSAQPRGRRLRRPRRARHRPLPRPRPQAGGDAHGRSPRRRVRRRRQALPARLPAEPGPEVLGRRERAQARPARRADVRPHQGQGRRRTSARWRTSCSASTPSARPRSGVAVPPHGRRLPRLRGHVPLRRDAGPGARHRRRRRRPGGGAADGSAGLRRRRLRQDRGGHPRRVPRGRRGAPGGRALPDDRPGAAALPQLPGADGRLRHRGAGDVPLPAASPSRTR